MYFSTDAASRDLNSSTVLCYKCGVRNFQELAYQFRRDIPREELPGVLNVSFIRVLVVMSADRSDCSSLFAARCCKEWENLVLARAGPEETFSYICHQN